ncbi:MAG: N-acetylmuramoyl-L-alanine amidase, partial [Sphingobacteriales bacterium]
VCLLVFFAAYKFLLGKLTFFKLNRLYLLSGLLICFLIPVLTIEQKREVAVHHPVLNSEIVYSTNHSVERELNQGGSTIFNFNWLDIAAYAYVFVAFVLLVKCLITIVHIRQRLKKYTIIESDSIIFVSANSKIKNCSFFNKIVVDASLSEHAKALIIKHESIHVNQIHIFDKLLVNLASCILWLNPVIYLWKREIDNNHEFLADEATTKTTDKGSYATLLLKLAMPAGSLVINTFSRLPLKNRIFMLYKKPDSAVRKMSYLITIPIISFCCLAFVNKKEVVIRKFIAEHNKVDYRPKAVEESVVVSPKHATDANKKPVATDTISSKKQTLLGSIFPVGNLSLEDAPQHKIITSEINHLATGRELVLVVDAGHGGRDGASKSASGIAEKDLNLRAAQILKEEATKRNIKVILTRERDKMIPLRERLPDEGATAFISIHHNSTPKPNMHVPFEGLEVIVSKQNPNIKDAEKFGFNVLKSLRQFDGLSVRDSLKDASLLLLRESKVPAIVIELGNISSEKSLAYFSDEKNLRQICNLVLDGFTAFTKS